MRLVSRHGQAGIIAIPLMQPPRLDAASSPGYQDSLNPNRMNAMRRTAFVVPFLAACTFCFVLFASQRQALAGPQVELFVTSWCPYCAKAEAYFAAKGIRYAAYDIEQNAAAAKRFQHYGQRGVPLVVINGTPIAGYSIAAYEKALEAPQTAPSHASSAPSR